MNELPGYKLLCSHRCLYNIECMYVVNIILCMAIKPLFWHELGLVVRASEEEGA